MRHHLIAIAATALFIAWLAAIPLTHGVSFIITMLVGVLALFYWLVLDTVRDT